MVVHEDIHSEDYDKGRNSCEDYGVRRHSCFIVSFLNKVRVTEVMLNPNPMSSSKDNESKSYPELDESALLVAQVKLPCVLEI